MSPIHSVTETFTLSRFAPSITSIPRSGEQSASMTSVRLLGTGGLLFAVVAIVSVAGYLYHGRTTANGARSSSTWTSFTSFISGIRLRGTDTSKAAAGSDSSRDLEISLEQHVSMIYARFFHPAHWNVVECHPGTTFIPAICVEDEVIQAPVSGPSPLGMKSFLDMNEETKELANHSKRAHEKPSRVRGVNIRVPPYDTWLCTNINFSSAIIGTTVRPGTFLSIPGGHEYEDTLPEDPSSEFEYDCSPYDGVVIIEDRNRPLPPLPPSVRRYGMADMSDLAESLKDAIPGDGDGLATTFSRLTSLVNATDFDETNAAMSCDHMSDNYWPTITGCDVGYGHARWEAMGTSVSCRPLDYLESVDDGACVDCAIGERESYDGFRITSSSTNTNTTLYEDIDGRVTYYEAYDGCVFEDMDETVSHYDGLRSIESATDTTVTGQERSEATVVNSDLNVHDSFDGSPTNKITTDTEDDFQEGLYLIERLLDELRPDFDCSPGDLSKESDNDTNYGNDNDDVTADNEQAMRKSDNSAPSAGVEDEVPVLPPTLPLNISKSRGATPSARKGHRRSPALKWINEGVEIAPATSSELSPSYQGNLVHGPRIPEEMYYYIRG